MAMMALSEVLPRVLEDVARRVDHVAELAAESRRAFAESAEAAHAWAEEWRREGHAGATDRVCALLSDARFILADPTRWIRGAAARAEDGAPVCASDPSAAGWSAIGALEKALLDRHYVTDARLGWCPAYNLVNVAAWTLHDAVTGKKIDAKAETHEAIAFVETWGDAASHDDLIAGFDRALARRVHALAARRAGR